MIKQEYHLTCWSRAHFRNIVYSDNASFYLLGNTATILRQHNSRQHHKTDDGEIKLEAECLRLSTVGRIHTHTHAVRRRHGVEVACEHATK